MKYQAVLIAITIFLLEVVLTRLVSVFAPTTPIFVNGGDFGISSPTKYLIFWAVLLVVFIVGVFCWRTRPEVASGLIAGSLAAATINFCFFCSGA